MGLWVGASWCAAGCGMEHGTSTRRPVRVRAPATRVCRPCAGPCVFVGIHKLRSAQVMHPRLPPGMKRPLRLYLPHRAALPRHACFPVPHSLCTVRFPLLPHWILPLDVSSCCEVSRSRARKIDFFEWRRRAAARPLPRVGCGAGCGRVRGSWRRELQVEVQRAGEGRQRLLGYLDLEACRWAGVEFLAAHDQPEENHGITSESGTKAADVP